MDWVYLIVLFAIITFTLVKGLFNRNSKGKIVSINEKNCSRCGMCVLKCNADALAMVNDEMGLHVELVNDNACVGCGNCVSVCNFNAIKLDNKRYKMSNEKEVSFN